MSDARADLTKIAAECHRAKWQFDLSEDFQPNKASARALILQAFHELHRIGDVALKLRDAAVPDPAATPVPNGRAKVIQLLWEKQFEGSPWHSKFHLIRPDSLEKDYGALADTIIAALASPHSRPGCICQEQHRRGYCTEPGCPYSLSRPTPASEQYVCSLCLGTGKVFHENPPRKDTPYSRCHCQVSVVSRPERGGK